MRREPESIVQIEASSQTSEQSWWKWVFVALVAIIFVVLPLMCLDAGNSRDEEPWHYPYSLRYYQYYTSLGQDTSYIDDTPMKFFGFAFDNVVTLIIKAFGFENNYMTVRHVCNALAGAFLMLFVGLLAKLLGGWRAGSLALLLIFFSPYILGHSLNNLKDIPLAACGIGAIYYIAWFIKEYPKPTLKTSLKMGVLLGAAIGIRPGGFLFFAYFGLFVLVYYLMVNKPRQYFSKSNIAILKKIFVQAAVASGAMLVVMFILWPYALRDPLHNIVDALKAMSNHPGAYSQVFEGKLLFSQDLPWYYCIKNICITSPIVVLMGGGVQLFAAHRQPKGWFWTFVLLFCFAFPIFWIAFTKAIVYGGWRHVMFVYPTLVVAAALGFNTLVNWAKNKKLKIVFTVLPVVLLFDPFIFTVKNHPYENLYFNRFVGGVKGAYGNYDLDVLDNSKREAAEWILADVAKNGAPDPTRKTLVATWHASDYYFRKDTDNFSINYVRWEKRNTADWDYAFYSIAGIYHLLLSKEAYPPKNTVHQVMVDGVPIALVLKREDRSSYYGRAALQQGNFAEAETQYIKALEYDAYDDEALADLVELYTRTGHYDSATRLVEHWQSFVKDGLALLNSMAYLYFYKKDFANALQTANTLTKLYPRHNIDGLWVAANVYEQQDNLGEAWRTLNEIITKQNHKPAYELMLNIANRMGDEDTVQQISERLKKLE
ncbi:hypothetical protein AGMMS4957_06280 [Bacteroidia bacterium]|nr:hypothetical protein AGMMS4957_06280 [Bacteroidia bacterium]